MKKILVKFGASWCGPCNAMTEIIENTDLNVAEVQFIDLDTTPEMAREYGIRGIPTLILYEDGTEIARHSGLMTKEALIKFVGD